MTMLAAIISIRKRNTNPTIRPALRFGPITGGVVATDDSLPPLDRD